jgi:hypothetical protein
MKAQDLRVNNLVKSGNGIYKIKAISNPYCVGNYLETNNACELDIRLIKPIDITPEILAKCGFSCFNDIEFAISISGGQLHLFLSDDSDNFIKWYPKGVRCDGYWMPFNGKYLHQLQNIIHSLTGNELEVKM